MLYTVNIPDCLGSEISDHIQCIEEHLVVTLILTSDQKSIY
jgi:hypothetical protein